MNTAFDELLKYVGSTKIPPIASWHPEREGKIDIRIRRDGVWLHEGTVIRREAIARVFSTILRREDDAYYLVTPVEKLRIVVDDVPFLAVDMEASNGTETQRILFRTNMREVVLLDRDHPIHIKHTKTGPRPYVLVRDGLYARVLNEVFYRLADLVEDPEAEPLYVWSYGQRFKVS